MMRCVLLILAVLGLACGAVSAGSEYNADIFYTEDSLTHSGLSGHVGYASTNTRPYAIFPDGTAHPLVYPAGVVSNDGTIGISQLINGDLNLTGSSPLGSGTFVVGVTKSFGGAWHYSYAESTNSYIISIPITSEENQFMGTAYAGWWEPGGSANDEHSTAIDFLFNSGTRLLGIGVTHLHQRISSGVTSTWTSAVLSTTAWTTVSNVTLDGGPNNPIVEAMFTSSTALNIRMYDIDDTTDGHSGHYKAEAIRSDGVTISALTFGTLTVTTQLVVAGDDIAEHLSSIDSSQAIQSSSISGLLSWQSTHTSNTNSHIDWTEATQNFSTTGSVRVGSASSYSIISNSGVLRLYGNATVWDDLRFPAMGQNLDSVAGVLDYDFDEVGVLFPNNASTNVSTEALSMVVQMPHSKKLGTPVEPHVHYRQTDTSQTNNWYMQYKWFNVGDTIPSTWTQIGPAVNVEPYSAGSMSQYAEFGAINPPANETVSSILLMQVSRDGDNDTYGGNDLLLHESDIHFEIDSLGSELEDVKY